MRLLLLSFLILLSSPDLDETKKGREGNKKFYLEEFAEAENFFSSGLEGSDPATKNRTTSGLYNNLGCALNKQEKFDEAAEAFRNAVNTSENQVEKSRALFNSGNNVVQMQQLDAALDFYKQALLSDPNNEAARYNYEFISRMKDQQQDQQNSGDNQQDQDEQEKQEQDQQDQDQENQDQRNQDQEQQSDQDENSEDENQQPQEQQKPNQMSQEEAERILQKLQSDEKELLKQAKRMKGTGKKVKKDW